MIVLVLPLLAGGDMLLASWLWVSVRLVVCHFHGASRCRQNSGNLDVLVALIVVQSNCLQLASAKHKLCLHQRRAICGAKHYRTCLSLRILLHSRPLILTDLVRVKLNCFLVFTHLTFTASASTINSHGFLIALSSAMSRVLVVVDRKVMLRPRTALGVFNNLALVKCSANFFF